MYSKSNYENISFDITSIALKAMLYEVACFPSPGLVSPVSTGAHRDMDFYTFIDSTVSLNKYLFLFCMEGFSDLLPKELFRNIREIGIEAEKSMFESTNGINTHKGMLFLMGICSAAVANTIYKKEDFNSISNLIKKMCEGITKRELENLNTKQQLSHGERLFKEYKIRGIRGEVEDGIPLAFEIGMKAYKDAIELNKNDRLVHTLISIMQYCEDSTILHRQNEIVLLEVRELSREIMKLGGMKSEKGRNKIKSINEIFIDRNISPGGSADILAIVVFLYEVEIYIKKLLMSK